MLKLWKGEWGIHSFLYIYKEPVYKQLVLDLQNVKQLLGLKHVTII